jgi:thioesterase domain-containing protein
MTVYFTRRGQLGTGPLRLSVAYRYTTRMREYRRFIGESVESGAIQGDIHLIVAPNSKDFVHSPTGAVIATLPGWKEMTRGCFQVYAGDGDHREMLTPPYLERNVELLKKILESPPAPTPR